MHELRPLSFPFTCCTLYIILIPRRKGTKGGIMTTADAMVTGRMTREKKEAGNRILASLGTTPSQAINHLYDFVIEKRELPFAKKNPAGIDPETLAEARAWARSLKIQQPIDPRFANMALKEAKALRLAKEKSQAEGSAR